MQICPQCGAEIPDESNFCPYCRCNLSGQAQQNPYYSAENGQQYSDGSQPDPNQQGYNPQYGGYQQQNPYQQQNYNGYQPPYDPYQQQGYPPANSGNATGLLIWSIINFLCCWPLAVAGLILTLTAKNEPYNIQESKLRQAKICNLIGTIVGVISIILSILVGIFSTTYSYF